MDLTGDTELLLGNELLVVLVIAEYLRPSYDRHSCNV